MNSQHNPSSSRKLDIFTRWMMVDKGQHPDKYTIEYDKHHTKEALAAIDDRYSEFMEQMLDLMEQMLLLMEEQAK